MGPFQQLETEIRSRFYRWALRDAEREVRAGYPLLQRIESRTTKIFLNYMSGLTEDAQLELALALARRVHEFSVRQNDDALTPREKQLAAAYIRFQLEYSDLDTEEGFIRSWVPRRAVGLPPRAKLKRKAFLNKVKTALTPVQTGFNERHWEEALWFEGKYNRWALKTAVNVGRPPHYFHYISADWRTVLTTTMTSWLGVGDGAWDVLYEDQSDAAAETFGLLCAHFMTAVPELLDGLDYDDSTLLEPVPRPPRKFYAQARFYELGQFLGAYFHQDWTVENADAESVVRFFIKENVPWRLRKVADEIEELLAVGMSEDELQEFLYAELGSYYMPTADGISYSDWLRSVREALVS